MTAQPRRSWAVLLQRNLRTRTTPPPQPIKHTIEQIALQEHETGTHIGTTNAQHQQDYTCTHTHTRTQHIHEPWACVDPSSATRARCDCRTKRRHDRGLQRTLHTRHETPTATHAHNIHYTCTHNTCTN